MAPREPRRAPREPRKRVAPPPLGSDTARAVDNSYWARTVRKAQAEIVGEAEERFRLWRQQFARDSVDVARGDLGKLAALWGTSESGTRRVLEHNGLTEYAAAARARVAQEREAKRAARAAAAAVEPPGDDEDDETPPDGAPPGDDAADDEPAEGDDEGDDEGDEADDDDEGDEEDDGPADGDGPH